MSWWSSASLRLTDGVMAWYRRLCNFPCISACPRLPCRRTITYTASGRTQHACSQTETNTRTAESQTQSKQSQTAYTQTDSNTPTAESQRQPGRTHPEPQPEEAYSNETEWAALTGHPSSLVDNIAATLAAPETEDERERSVPKSTYPKNTEQPQAEVRNLTTNKGSTIINARTLHIGCNFYNNDVDDVTAALWWHTEEESKKTDARNKELENILRNFLSQQSATLLEQTREMGSMRQQIERLQESMQQISREPQAEQARRYMDLLSHKAEVEKKSAVKIAFLQERLREESRLADQKLTALKARHEEESREEQDQVRTFILAVESNVRQIASAIDELQLVRVADRLHEKFNVRLVAVTCGLTFVMQTTSDEWARLAERQMEIQEELLGLVPEEYHEGTSWQRMASCPNDVDLRLGEPLPTSISSVVTEAEHGTAQTPPAGSASPSEHENSQRQQAEHNTEQTMPKFPESPSEHENSQLQQAEHDTDHQTLQTRPVSSCEEENGQHQEDEPDIDETISALTFDPASSSLLPCDPLLVSLHGERNPDITALLVAPPRIFAADRNNAYIKAFSLSAPHLLEYSLFFPGRPYGLALEADRQWLAVTALSDNAVVLISIKARAVVRSLRTARRYRGVGSCGDGTLVVSCEKDKLYPASVDILTLEGQVLKTIASSDEVTSLISPWNLCVYRSAVYLSDRVSNCVHQADLVTGRLTTLPRHRDLKEPCQVSADYSGNLYVACWESRSVLVRKADEGWGVLLRGDAHGVGSRVCARCVCVAGTGLLLVAWEGVLGGDTAVKAYQFASSLNETFSKVTII